MAQKKEKTETTDKKPNAKVQDLAPKKDAKGGGGVGIRLAGGKGLQSGGVSPSGGTGLR